MQKIPHPPFWSMPNREQRIYITKEAIEIIKSIMVSAINLKYF